MQVVTRVRDFTALSHEIQQAPKTQEGHVDLGYCTMPAPNQVLNRGVLHTFADPTAAKQYILSTFW